MAVAVILSGCTTAVLPEPSPELLVISGVQEFQAQERGEDCTGVALASLLGHTGMSGSPTDIDADAYEPRLSGTLLLDLEKFAAGAGARASPGRGSLDDFRQPSRAGRPVLVPIDLGWSLWRRPHYVVLYGGCDDDVKLPPSDTRMAHPENRVGHSGFAGFLRRNCVFAQLIFVK